MPTTDKTMQETIRLQLRKPKSWNWELSTSKSSPHITLPVIQLFDYKGKLLVETEDSGDTARKIWGSSGARLSTVGGGLRKNESRLARSRSDTLHRNFHGKPSQNHELINRDNKNKQQNNFVKSLDDDDTPKAFQRKTSNTNGGKTLSSRFPDRNVIEENPQKDNGLAANRLQKCQSDLVGRRDNGMSLNTKPDERSSLSCFPLDSKNNSQVRRHRRSRSDDLFRRKLRYNDVENAKRSETEFSSNFITSHIPEEKQEQTNKYKNALQAADHISSESNGREIDVNNIKEKKYTTRTSSAGTLIIPEESFRNATARRRRQRRGDAVDADSQRLNAENFERKNTAASRDAQIVGNDSKERRRRRCRDAVKHHARQASDPCNFGKFVEDAFHRSNAVDGAEKQRRHVYAKSTPCIPRAHLFSTKSQVFPFEKLLNIDYAKFDENHNNRTSSTAAIPSNETRENGGAIMGKLNRKKRRKVRDRMSDGSSTSSGTMERRGGRRKGHLIKEHSARRLKSNDAVDNGGGASDLLQLVRRLSYTTTTTTTSAKGCDDVKMGANVSRHSVKGLSGRRSQSSGSICNGSGGSSGKNSRHPDGKICSSLPNYLDEREKNGACNNNRHDHKSLDEVDRIPPLGDGAPLHWKFSDTQTALCDQGYGSERSPEEEYPPPLPDHDHLQCHHHLDPHACYPFVTPDSTFLVKLMKGSRGLGLSVTGGIDSAGSWPGLIRIKRLFPHQPASSCGLLNVGDLLLEANGITLTGLTNYEALEVLRTAPNQVELKVCRPPPDVLNCVSPISEVPPPPPRREPPNSLNLPSAIYSTPEDEYYHGEFEITLTKIQGSLGFTLRKEDDSALGHYVRALVREPALTDGRIRAGDKIIAVNDVEICPMSHEQAVQFLRQCPEVVKLRLYRDSAQTPVATLSPSETTPRTSFSRKAHLRQEAVDMLNDLAGRKLGSIAQDIYHRSLSPELSPRRHRRQTCPSDASQSEYEQFHEGLLQQCPHPFDEDAFNSLFTMESDDGDRPSRPASLDLYNPNQTPVAARKPRFNFSLAHNAYELNNLDADVLDAPNLTYNLGSEDVQNKEPEGQQPVSMPHIPLNNSTFSYKHPAYQSAHPQIGTEPMEPTLQAKSTSTRTDSGTLKRRKSSSSVARQEVEPNSGQKLLHPEAPMREEYEVLAIELNRGWNSRLGFSLQGAAGVTYVSAVHADSVAAKDGRLKPGDRLIKVNDESIEHMTTSEIIDLLRIVRGPVCIVISRVKSNEDCLKSNAEN